MESPPKFDVIVDPSGSYKIKNGRDLCLEFEFIEDVYEDEDEYEDEYEDGSTVLHISKIFKCGDGKYTRELIKMIENMAVNIQFAPWSRVKYIKLEDGSSIHVCDVDIDLRYLKILTTGESWYNSFGYKSVNHDANVAHNAVIINKPMHLLLSELVDQQYFDQAYITKIKARFPELSTDLTVKEYVTAMSKAVPRSGTRTCIKEQEKRARVLSNLVDYFVWVVRQDDDTNPNYLKYDFRLQKKVERGTKGSPRTSLKPGGGAKRTLRKSCRKPRKPRKTRNPRKTRKTRTHKCMKRKTA